MVTDNKVAGVEWVGYFEDFGSSLLSGFLFHLHPFLYLTIILTPFVTGPHQSRVDIAVKFLSLRTVSQANHFSL